MVGLYNYIQLSTTIIVLLLGILALVWLILGLILALDLEILETPLVTCCSCHLEVPLLVGLYTTKCNYYCAAFGDSGAGLADSGASLADSETDSGTDSGTYSGTSVADSGTDYGNSENSFSCMILLSSPGATLGRFI